MGPELRLGWLLRQMNERKIKNVQRHTDDGLQASKASGQFRPEAAGMGPELRSIGFAFSKQKTKNACVRVPCNGDFAAFCLRAQAGLPVLLNGTAKAKEPAGRRRYGMAALRVGVMLALRRFSFSATSKLNYLHFFILAAD